MIEGKSLLVVSAHAADYVWRSGGTIARYISGGARVTLAVLSLGSRGESEDLWKQPNQTEAKVKAIRREECLAAAEKLGIEQIELSDYQDYPLEFSPETTQRMQRLIREARPDIILTHDRSDILNPDHDAVHKLVFGCAIQSNSGGLLLEGTTPTKQMRFFGFEPHQTELSHFVPGMFVDISQEYEKKVEAMNCFKTQQHLIEIYKQRAFLRGNHARRLSGNQDIRYAECFASIFPVVAGELV